MSLQNITQRVLSEVLNNNSNVVSDHDFILFPFETLDAKHVLIAHETQVLTFLFVYIL